MKSKNKNNQNQSTSFYLTRYEQTRKKANEPADGLSSYFPMPQADVKKPSEHWKTVPAPPPAVV